MEYKELSNIVKDLAPLRLDVKKKRELIKGVYSCIGRMYGFPRIFKISIQEAKEKDLKQEKAYEYLIKSLNKHDEEIAMSISYKKDYSTYANNLY